MSQQTASPRHINLVSRRASLPTRIGTLIHRAELDEQIAKGASLGGSRQIALRAQQLVKPRERQRLARALERTIEIARQPLEAHEVRTAPVISARVPLATDDVLACADDITALARRLRAPDPVEPRGVARLRVLALQGDSPLYVGEHNSSLRHALRSARLELEPLPALEGDQSPALAA